MHVDAPSLCADLNVVCLCGLLQLCCANYRQIEHGDGGELGAPVFCVLQRNVFNLSQIRVPSVQ